MNYPKNHKTMKIKRLEAFANSQGATDRKPINVLFVNDHLGFSDGVIHGPARYFLNILNAFNPSIVNPKLCIFRDWHPFAQELESEGIRPIFLSRHKWNPYVLFDLILMVRKLKIDILHLAGMKGCLIGRLVSRMTGTPAIIHFRDMNPAGFVTRFLQRRLSRWTDAALAVSDPIRAFAIKEYAIKSDRIAVLHNPISADFLNNRFDGRDKIREEFKIPSEEKVIGVIGRLSPEKGHKSIIKALPKLISLYPKIIFLIVGDGPIKNECELLTQKLQLGHKVRFTGYRNDIPAILSAVDIIAMPSEREGFPNAALESIAAGKPVVGFRVGGLPEIVIDGRTGFLSNPGDIDDIVNSLFRVLSDNKLAEKLGNGCTVHAKKFTVERHIQRLEEIYRDLVSICERDHPGKQICFSPNGNEIKH